MKLFRSRYLLLLAALGAMPAQAQLLHHGVDGVTRVTEKVVLHDSWQDGSSTGARDVLVRLVEVHPGATVARAHLLLLGPWGAHAYGFEEDARRDGLPDSTSVRTTWRALDLDADGRKELVFIERTLTRRVARDEMGRELEEPGPFFESYQTRVRYLAREKGALVEHDLEPDPDAAAFKALLLAEDGATLAGLQLAAGDWLFTLEKYEAAKYRYLVVREWAERALPGRHAQELDPAMPLVSPDMDEPSVAWIAAIRRFGSLPRYYQRH